MFQAGACQARIVCHGRTLLAGCCLVLAAANAALAETPQGPPPAVTVTSIRVSDVAPVYSFVGRVKAIQTVQLLARVTAFLEKIDFQQGGNVQQGQVLFELQRPPFEAAVQAAQAQLAKAQAAYVQAQPAFERSARLNQQGFEAQANLDQARATRDSAAADVEAAKANLATAALNLSYCTIVAPVSGRIGATTYTVGNLVSPTSQPLATINQLDPIRVAFSVADRELVGVQQRSNASAEQIATSLTVSLKLANGTQYDQQGKIAFLDNQVDPATGTITVWADFANPNRLLLPGGFVTVELRSARPQERPLLPVAAVQTDEKGNYVLLVTPDNKVQQQRVQLGSQIAQDFIVNQGLSADQRVIVGGVQKVQPGQVVDPTATASQPSATTRAGG
jgi:membrane fusion protein (multidrug efflux system)